jgi:prevent-host-death family protein
MYVSREETAMEMNMVDVRANFAEVVNRVAYGGERVVMKRRSKGVAAVVSMEDLKLLEELEDRADVKAALKARKEKGGVTLAQYRKKHGL